MLNPKFFESMPFQPTILADSINWTGKRLTTFKIPFWKLLLAELNTHRVLSKSANSSRAIPTEKIIENLLKGVRFYPLWTGRQKGMSGNEELTEKDIHTFNINNDIDCKNACEEVMKLINLGLHKQQATRKLEYFMWASVIITGTDWNNFFTLRTAQNAQPEFREIAKLMFEQYNDEKPVHLEVGEWHIPFCNDKSIFIKRNLYDVTSNDVLFLEKEKLIISASSCAKQSYDKSETVETLEKHTERFKMLVEAKHMGVFEHQARVPSVDEIECENFISEIETNYYQQSNIIDTTQRIGKYHSNLKGWIQFRKVIESDNWIQQNL